MTSTKLPTTHRNSSSLKRGGENRTSCLVSIATGNRPHAAGVAEQPDVADMSRRLPITAGRCRKVPTAHEVDRNDQSYGYGQ
ncbi:hypothetical protein BaRGS_00036935 [Batillaria attramentaria]|uniref:Uncharacterized protein n=1 Tax=Batillaria attramentaria TaxID=370345 RepID=A0ABD0JAC1_9CAEN